MKILYVGMKHDYGKPQRGYSFEHYNFAHTFLQMGQEVLYFDFMGLMQERGREWMNRRLLEIARAEGPDLLFCILFTNELDQAVIREISQQTDTLTLNWFCDDHWRFDNFSRHWAPCFNWVVTTAQSALPKYARAGYQNVIKSQWACNHFLYRKLDLPFVYDVTFVGQPHGDRPRIIEAIRNAGVNIQVWGTGWEAGRIPQEQMIEVFNQSRINLNLTNASRTGSRFKPWKRWFRRSADQIKGRNFEVPGCGGFLLTAYADNLSDYYVDADEIVVFTDTADLIEKIRYYLAHESERAVIAEAGYRRTLRDHTYERRFNEIFALIGLVGR